MGKKSTKKKTIWRTLSIGDITPTSNTSGSTKETKKDYRTSINIDLRAQPNNNQNGKLSTTSSELSNNENRNSFNTNNNYNYNKSHNNSSNAALPNSSSSQEHPQYNKTYLPYKRRPFSTKSLNYNNYYSNNNSSNAGGNYRSNYRYRINNYNNSDKSNTDVSQNNKSVSPEKKESNFNEDEYTRITTPRQDVLFKKGYLSKPKKYLKYNDSHTPSSSGAMSVISTEESTTTSTQSVTPENFNSIPENPDESEFTSYPYHSFIDQNGLFYVNPYSFDPYGGQMFMMPYPTSANCQQPFNTNSFDIYDNSQITTTSTSPVSFNHNNVNNMENNENSSQTAEVNPDINIVVDEETKNIKDISEEGTILNEGETTDNDNLNVEKETPLENQITATEEEEKHENIKTEENIENTVLDYTNDNAPYYQPVMYYPYYYCPPQSMYPVNDLSYTNGYGIPYDNYLSNKYFKYKKRKRKPRKTLNSSGVTTDDCSDDESTDNEYNHSYYYIPFANTQTSETTKCYLNVEVEEFQPKCYTPKLDDVFEKPSSTENISFPTKQDTNSDIINPDIPLSPNSTPFVPNYSNVLKMDSKDTNKKTAINNINLNKNSINNKTKKKNNKKSISKPAVISSQIKTPVIHQVSLSNEPTYAQMLNGGNKTNVIESLCEPKPKPIEVIQNEITTPTKVVTPKKVEKWQTVVKSKGKRGKNIQLEETDVTPELTNENEIEIKSESSHDIIITNDDNIMSTARNDEDNLIINDSSSVVSSISTKKSSSTKPKPKSKSSKKNSKRKILQTKSQNGFEVIEPTFAVFLDGEEEQHYKDEHDFNNLTEFDSFIEEVQDVINGDVETIEKITINVDHVNEGSFSNFDFIEIDELDKDFDIIEKTENNNYINKADEKRETITTVEVASPPIENIVEKEFYNFEQNIMNFAEKEIIIDLDEELKNGCAIENKINGQVEEIIEKITVNEIESICNKIEQELSIDDNHVAEDKVSSTNDDLQNFIEEDNGNQSHIACTKLNDLCDKTQEETEKILLSNNVKENDVTVIKENINVKENGLSTTLKFPLTEAVTKWLFEKENQKTTITEPLLRLPNDPILSSKIQLMILSRTQFFDDDDEWTTESETELEHDDSDVHKTKNYISNPLPVSSHNSSNEDINNMSIIDTDSDYMSDSQIRTDDNTRKRVAASKNYDSDTTITATTLSSNNHSKLSSKSLDNNTTKLIDKKCIKLPFTDVCCVLM